MERQNLKPIVLLVMLGVVYFSTGLPVAFPAGPQCQ